MEQREKERILWNLKSMPNELTDLLAGLDEETLRWRPIPDKWSVKEVLCHLRDLERELYPGRFRLILTEENPYLPKLDQVRLADERDYQNQDAAGALAEFKEARAANIQVLESAPLESWSRTGVHFAAGPSTLESMAVRQSSHDARHLIQMKDIVRLTMPW